jgi:hypothetical protein
VKKLAASEWTICKPVPCINTIKFQCVLLGCGVVASAVFCNAIKIK